MPNPVNPNLYELARDSGRAVVPRGYKYHMKPGVEEAIVRGDTQFVLDSLTEKQRNFVTQYLVDENGAKALVRAGYETKNTGPMTSQLLKNPAIRYCIDALKAQRADYVSVTSDYVLNKILDVITRSELADKYDGNVVLRATEQLGRYLGLFKERQEISGPNGGPIETMETENEAAAFKAAINRLATRASNEV